MSYIGNYHQLDPSLLKTLTGDAGGAVPATLNNIDILGGDNIGTVGVIAASTITVNLDKSIAQPVTNAAGTEGLYTLGGVDFISNYGTDNAFFGGAGNRTLTTATAIKNVAIGSQALTQITTAHENIAIGYNSLGSMISGGNSIAIGAEALLGVTATPGTNIAIGYNALKRVTTTCNNTAVGTNACVHLGWAGGNASQNSFFGFGSAPTMKNGDWNTGIGYETFTLMNLTATTGTCFNNLAAGAIAGYYWEDAEQGNIALGSLGRVGESNVIRIGNTQDTTLAVIPGPGPLNKQTKCFIAGIRGITPVTADAQSVVIDSLGQLGTLGTAANGEIAIGSVGVNPVLSTLTAGIGVGITNAAGSITIDAAGVDQSNIIYVGKHGNDANDGLTIDKAKLTFGSAITAAFAIAPAVINCFDEGTYTEDLTGQVDVHIFAPNCNLTGAHTIAAGNKWEFGSAAVATGTTGFTFNSAGNIAKLIIGKITVAGTGIGIACIAGDLYLRTYRVTLATGYLVGTATAGEIFIRADVIHMTGAATVIGVIAGAHIDLLCNHIHDVAGTATLVYSVAVGASNICITATSIDIENLSNIAAATVANLNVGCLAGTLTESGAAKFIIGGATKIDGVPIGAGTASTGDFTTITTTTAIDVAYAGTGLASPTDHALLAGSGAAAMTALAVGATNEVLLGNTGADPSWGAVDVTTDITGTLPVTSGGTGVATFTTAYAVVCAGTTATNPLQPTASAGSAGEVLTSNGAAALPSWQAGGGGVMARADATGATQAMAVDTEYTTNRGAGIVAYTLPAAASVGEVIEVVGSSANGWSIAQNAGQTIHFSLVDTTPGVGGSLASANRYDCVRLKCTVTNTNFVATNSSGNPTIV